MQTGAAPATPPPPEISDDPPESELLEAGPARGRRFRLPVVIVVVGLVLLGLLAWQFWPRPVAPITLTELEGIYAGMVRGDGTNDAAPIDLRNNPSAFELSPTDCQPLFEVTTLDGHPPEAQDGIGTFWMGERVGASLSTYRFADAAAARRVYARVATALAACDGQRATIDYGRTWTAAIERTSVDTSDGIDDQLGYLYSPRPAARFAVHVLRYENLVTWQFRYETSDNAYAPLPAQQIMDSLVAQTKAVVELRGK